MEISGTDVAQAPAIMPAYLSHPEDVAQALRGARLLRRLENTDAMRGLIREPIAPRLDAMDEEIAELRRNAAAPGQVQAASGGPAFSTAPIERAVMRLSERLQRVEEVVAPADSGRGSFLARMFRRG